jgi:16S rRNA (guanine(527)-N(7))-methyltransferase RsmG
LPEAGARPPEYFTAEIGRQIPPFELSLDQSRVELLARYLAELDLWRRRTNLTGPMSAEDLVAHVLESAFGERLIPHGARLLDIGSGAGLPGIPLAIARLDLAVTLLEPRARRVTFLRHVARTVPVVNVAVDQARALQQRLAGFSAATCRGVANLAAVIGRAEFLEPKALLLAWTTEPQEIGKVLAATFALERTEPVPGSRRKVVAVYRKLPIGPIP